MKRWLTFLRSMRFGMLLLTAIAALSVIGTLVPQGQSAEYYQQAYENVGDVLLFVGADHMYSTWYYVVLFAALCLNLSLCSLLRVGRLCKAKEALIGRVSLAQPQTGMDAEAAERVLKRLHYKKAEEGVYIRRTWGLYGSFITHLGMLLLVIAASCTFALEEKSDHYVMVGDTLELPGMQLAVDSFSMENREGQLDYISELTLTGENSMVKQAVITVNNPARFGSYTVYQQSYAFAAVLDVQTAADAPAEQVVLDDTAFISLDGVNGIQYMSVYGDYVEYDDGQIMPTSAAGMERPCYLVGVFDGDAQEMAVLLPDEPLEVGGVIYTFRTPAAYPGLRIKNMPGWVLPLLYTSFGVLVAGLYLCFFCVPSAVCLKDGMVRVVSGKDSIEALEELKWAIEDQDNASGQEES